MAWKLKQKAKWSPIIGFIMGIKCNNFYYFLFIHFLGARKSKKGGQKHPNIMAYYGYLGTRTLLFPFYSFSKRVKNGKKKKKPPILSLIIRGI
jgi:hypothetical protein